MFGVLFLCGAALVSLSLVLSHPGSASEAPIAAIAGLATVAGLALIMIGDRVRPWMLHAATAAATLLVCLAIYFSGVASGVYAMMFVWIVVTQCYFFPGRVALAHLAWLLAVYGAALWALGPTDGYAPLSLWLLTALALGVTSAIASWLALGRRRAEREARRFFDLAQDMLCTAGPCGYFLALNDAWPKTLGHSPDELRSRPLIEFIHPADRIATEARMERLLDGDVIALENRFRAKDGSWHWLTWSALRDDHDGLVYARATDVTEHRLLERQRQAPPAEVPRDRGGPAPRAAPERVHHPLRR